jgi:hypothetical protein
MAVRSPWLHNTPRLWCASACRVCVGTWGWWGGGLFADHTAHGIDGVDDLSISIAFAVHNCDDWRIVPCLKAMWDHSTEHSQPKSCGARPTLGSNCFMYSSVTLVSSCRFVSGRLPKHSWYLQTSDRRSPCRSASEPEQRTWSSQSCMSGPCPWWIVALAHTPWLSRPSRSRGVCLNASTLTGFPIPDNRHRTHPAA